MLTMDPPGSPASFDNPLYAGPGADYMVMLYGNLLCLYSCSLQSNPLYDGIDDEYSCSLQSNPLYDGIDDEV